MQRRHELPQTARCLDRRSPMLARRIQLSQHFVNPLPGATNPLEEHPKGAPREALTEPLADETAALPQPQRLPLPQEDKAQTARRCCRVERGPLPVGPDRGRVAVAKCSAPRCCRLGRGPWPVVPDQGRVAVVQTEGNIELLDLARVSQLVHKLHHVHELQEKTLVHLHTNLHWELHPALTTPRPLCQVQDHGQQLLVVRWLPDLPAAAAAVV